MLLGIVQLHILAATSRVGVLGQYSNYCFRTFILLLAGQQYVKRLLKMSILRQDWCMAVLKTHEARLNVGKQFSVVGCSWCTSYEAVVWCRLFIILRCFPTEQQIRKKAYQLPGTLCQL